MTELSEVYTPRCEILTYNNEVYKVKESYSDIKDQIEEALKTYRV
ncbi:hypothetical protein [Staphylococcus epidermidis]